MSTTMVSTGRDLRQDARDALAKLTGDIFTISTEPDRPGATWPMRCFTTKAAAYEAACLAIEGGRQIVIGSAAVEHRIIVR